MKAKQMKAMKKTAAKQQAGNKARRFTFTCAPDDAGKVFLAGSFNNWSPTATPMRKSEKNGAWKRQLMLKPGPHEYRFVVDGDWIADPDAVELKPNPYGGHNSVAHV